MATPASPLGAAGNGQHHEETNEVGENSPTPELAVRIEEDDEILGDAEQVGITKLREEGGLVRRLSRKLLTRPDSLDEESMRVKGMDHAAQIPSTALILKLAFQSIGVVYGDLGTSPLYVYSSTFTKGIKSNQDILGVLSLIIYTIIAVPLIKYIFIVLHANDHGEGEAS